MTGPVGSASVLVVADGKRFRNDLRRILREASDETVEVGVDIDSRNLRRNIQRAVRGLPDVEIKTKVDDSDTRRSAQRSANRFASAFQRALRGVGRALIAPITIDPRSLPAGLFALAATAVASLAGAFVQLAAAVAPAVGILAAVPAALGGLIAGVATLRVALAGVGDAFEAALGDDAAKFEESLKNLAPAAQDAARALRSLRPEFQALRNAVQGAFFEGLDTVIRDVADTLLGPMQRGMRNTASAMNGLIRAFAQVATEGQSVRFISDSFRAAAAVIRNLTQPLANLARAFVNVGVAAFGVRGGISQLGTGLASIIDRFSEFLNRAAAGGQITVWIRDAIAIFQQLGQVIANVAGIFGSIGRAAQQAGGSALGVFGQLLQGVNDFLRSAEGQDFLVSLFRGLNQVGQALLPVLRAIGGALAPLFPIIARVATALGPGLTTLVNALGRGLAAAAPALVPLAQAISGIVKAISPLLPLIGRLLGIFLRFIAQGLKAATPLITAIAQGLIAIFEPLLPVIEELAGILVDVLTPVFKTLAEVVTLLAPVLAQIIKEVVKNGMPAFRQFAKVLIELLPPLGKLIVALVEELLPVIIEILPPLLRLLLVFAKLAIQLLRAVLPAIITLIRWLTAIIRVVGPVIAFIARLVGALIGGLARAISFVIGWIIRIIGWFVRLGGTVPAVISAVVGAAFSLGAQIGAAFRTVLGWINRLVGWFIALPGRILNALGNIGEQIGNAISSGLEGLGDTLGFADGGVVARDGLYRVAERNRPEAIIPLHPSKRRQRDKVLASSGLRDAVLAGAGGDGDASGRPIEIHVHTSTVDESIVAAKVEAALKRVLR